MIALLKGVLAEITSNQIILDVSGVGYLVEIPIANVARLPALGQAITLYVHTHVREDQLKLYGFSQSAERQLFALLLDISGVGPKTALAMISTLGVHGISNAVENQDFLPFEKAPGVGRRLAEKVLIELKPKANRILLCALQVGVRQGAQVDVVGLGLEKVEQEQKLKRVQLEDDLRSALQNLGYKEKIFTRFLPDVLSQEQDLPGALRRILVLLGSGHVRHEKDQQL